MRMRKLRHLQPRMEQSGAVQIREPKSLCGNWRSLKPDASMLCVEIGCGKGKFTVDTAKANPDMLMAAIEKVEDCLVMGMEYAVREQTQNVFFISDDAANLCEIFGRGEVDRLYLNFSDPWPRKKNAKRRLTHHIFLERYAWVLAENGTLEFKSDNTGLFEFTREELLSSGWLLSEVTDDLHANGPVGIMTGYEEKFYEEGKPIHRLVARPTVRPAEKPIRQDLAYLNRNPEEDSEE